ncbi:GIY-YIG nuclease family protein [Fibrobacter sp. UWEL]|uniref:GIY-YIG nuclease family protein n=1 Tax=Fibrobacter sp. UWEL TaxID=1896209 RepID=UPI00091F46C9|nr:GIY-YIG nuclease family protein [Fibrobacter sp. UWEL]SHK46301.1 putative endonuclease [Fibrobacter sp. UWEL]
MQKKSYTYILFNKKNGSLYVGVTSDLKNRVTQHKEKVFEGFTKKYGIDKLGYYEEHTDIRFAIEREKSLKNLLRRKKIELIHSMNPEWQDLYYQL